MNLFSATTDNKIPKEIQKRLTAGLIISLLVHAFVLSLQFGLPGLGLPGLEAPWNKRRAESPELAIQIVNMPVGSDSAASATATAASSPTRQLTPAPVNASAMAAASAIPAQRPVTDSRERSESQPAISGIRLVAPQKAEPAPRPVDVKATHKPRSAKKAKLDTTPPLAQKRQVKIADVQRIITQDMGLEDSFSVAVPSPDDLPKKADTEPDPKRQYDEIAQAGVEESAEEKAARMAERELKRQKREDLMRKKADELAQQAVADGKEQLDQLGKQAAEDNRKQAEEASNREAAALALQKQQEAEEQNRRDQREAAMAAKQAKLEEQMRQDENKRQEEERQLRGQQLQLALTQAQKDQQQREQQQRDQLAREQQLALENEKRRQEEQRQQAAERQKQADELAAMQKNEERLAKQKADELAARQRDEQAAQQRAAQTQAQAESKTNSQVVAANDQASNKQTPNSGNNSGQNITRQNNLGTNKSTSAGNENSEGKGNTQGNTSDPFGLPDNTKGSDLASRARNQVRGLDLLRGTPPAQRTNLEEKPQRRSLFGSQARDVPLRLYIESWKQKIERNGNLNYSQFSKDRARGDPVVVVSIRSDGSVEDVSIIRSSGRADIDDAVRRIVRLNAKYAAFPPNIAAQYDVIEIRRIWNFEDNLRLVEELR